MDLIEELITRGVANIISNKQNLEKVLRSEKKLHIYLGIDPTATKIHLGHAVPLRKLQAFAELGHKVTFLIGDFTARIGDTSDKNTERPVLTIDEIEENFKTYKKQAEKILDFTKVHIVYNSSWLKTLSGEDIMKLTDHFSVGDFVGRELIRRRLDDNKRVSLRETLYPVMQGYDSYHIDADIQIGGTDQTFNMQAGRTLQKDLRGKDSFVLATEFLIGTDGRKMSKSWGNAIWLDDTPEDIYAKVMAITDEIILQYYTLTTTLPLKEIEAIQKQLAGGVNPRDIKKELAKRIVLELYSAKEAQLAETYFEKTVQKKEIPENMPIFHIKRSENFFLPIDLLMMTGMTTSKAEAKRLIEQGGVEIHNQRINDSSTKIALEDDMIMKIGKRKFVKIKTKE